MCMKRMAVPVTATKAASNGEIRARPGTALRHSSMVGAKPSGELVATGLRPKFLDKLAIHGVDLPAQVFHQASTAPTGRGVHLPSLKDLASAERSR